MISTKKKELHLGVLGKKLGHSLSPEIHADLFRQQNLSGSYEKYEMSRDDLPHLFEFMKEHNITGLNVTIPYKEDLFQMVDILDDHAKAIGAINTVHLKDGISYGYNTDYIGVTSMLKKAGFNLSGKHTIAARNEEAKELLKNQFPYIETCTLNEIPSGDLIINTTPVGMFPNVGNSAVRADTIRKFKVAADIVYNPLITEFLRIAKKENLQIITGLMMLVDQAIGSEEIWLEKKLDYHMGDSIHAELAKRFL